MPFGQLVVGPPGSGKSTYCHGMQQYLTAQGRKVAVVNLDPANDTLPYECAVDLVDLVSLDETMQNLQLGPNGGLMYCMDYLLENVDWLEQALTSLAKDGFYFIFDCPGQTELLTLHSHLRSIFAVLEKKLHLRLASVLLVDAHLCGDGAKYIAALLMALGVMMSLELPHINVLSKVDLVGSYGELAFGLDYYTEASAQPARIQVHNLSYLLESMGGAFSQQYRKLSKGLCEVVEDFSLVGFVPLAIEDAAAMKRLLALIDKATGYVFAGLRGEVYPPEFVYAAGVSDAGGGSGSSG